jgi:hypothetical protein
MDTLSTTSTVNEATKSHYSFRQGDKSTFSFSSHERGGDTYIFQLRGRASSAEPTVFLVRQSDNEVVLSATRSGLTSTFQIYAGDARTADDGDGGKGLARVTLQLDQPDSIWSLADAEGKGTEYAWVKTSRVNVDGVGKTSGLMRRSYKLVARDRPDDALAVFLGNQGFSVTGTMQLEERGVSLGEHFEHMALMTLACQNARDLQGTNTNPVGNLGTLPIGGAGGAGAF